MNRQPLRVRSPAQSACGARRTASRPGSQRQGGASGPDLHAAERARRRAVPFLAGQDGAAAVGQGEGIARRREQGLRAGAQPAQQVAQDQVRRVEHRVGGAEGVEHCRFVLRAFVHRMQHVPLGFRQPVRRPGQVAEVAAQRGGEEGKRERSAGQRVELAWIGGAEGGPGLGAFAELFRRERLGAERGEFGVGEFGEAANAVGGEEPQLSFQPALAVEERQHADQGDLIPHIVLEP